MKTQLAWQSKFIKDISEMSDRELLWETMNFAGGDDIYSDGDGFSDKGKWKYNQLKNELNKRLPKSFQGFDKGEGFYD